MKQPILFINKIKRKNKLLVSSFLIITFLTFGMFSSQVQSQNMILAGQSEGEHTHYTEYAHNSMVVLAISIGFK